MKLELLKLIVEVISFGLITYYCCFSKYYASYEAYKKREEGKRPYMGWYYGSKFVFWMNRTISSAFFVMSVITLIYRILNGDF